MIYPYLRISLATGGGTCTGFADGSAWTSPADSRATPPASGLPQPLVEPQSGSCSTAAATNCRMKGLRHGDPDEASRGPIGKERE